MKNRDMIRDAVVEYTRGYGVVIHDCRCLYCVTNRPLVAKAMCIAAQVKEAGKR